MSEIRFKSDIDVEEIQQVGSDAVIVAAARVSTLGWASVPGEESYGLLRFLMKSRHGSVFEHGQLTVRVHAPIKVWREWHRHRVGWALQEDGGGDWSFNEESGRYKTLEPVFYVPPRERLIIRPEGFKSSRPAFDRASDEEYFQIVESLKRGYTQAYKEYEFMLLWSTDRGLARDVLGVGIYSACYCTANPRSIMSFLSLRTHEPTATFVSHPLYEIEVAARKLEAIFAKHWPQTYRAFVECGRVGP